MLDSFMFSVASDTADNAAQNNLISKGWAVIFIVLSVIAFAFAVKRFFKYAVFHSTYRGRHIPFE